MTDDRLSEMAVLESSMTGVIDFHRNIEESANAALEAEVELWDRDSGLVDAAGGLPELVDKLRHLSRRPELSHRQRSLALMLLARAKAKLRERGGRAPEGMMRTPRRRKKRLRNALRKRKR